MTLREVVERHTTELYNKANLKHVEPHPKLGAAGERAKVRFVTKSNGFDFVSILNCSSSLQPLLKFQRALKKRSKRRHEKKLAEMEAKRLAGIQEEDDDQIAEDGTVEPMAHLKKKRPEFRD